MTDEEKIAERIDVEHRTGKRFSGIARELGHDLDAAYRVQEALVKLRAGRSGATAAGWKIGLTSKRMQAFCGLDEPVVGVVLADRVSASPGCLRHADYQRLGLEMELAVRVGRGAEHVTGENRDHLLSCIDAVAPAFELIDDRAADYSMLDPYSLVADNSWNAGMVLGNARPLDELLPLVGRVGTLRRNGQEVDRGRTEDAGGDPLDVVAWLAKMLRSRGRHLEPNQWFLTGSLMPTTFPDAGSHYEFQVEGFDPCELQIL